jgi:hypothetical protein
MIINALPQMQLSRFWEGTRLHEITLKQGSLDGACGIYSLMLMLMLQFNIKAKAIEKLWDGKVDKRTRFGKWQTRQPVLMTKGTSIKDLSELLDALRPDLLGKRHRGAELVPLIKKSEALSNKERLQRVAQRLRESKMPVLVGLEWDSNSAHWVVAIGSQYSNRSKDPGDVLAALLLVDLGADFTRVAAWNGILSEGPLRAKKLLYVDQSDAEQTCRLTEAFALEPRMGSKALR